MVIVVVINTLTALILLYVAWKLRRLQRRLRRIVDELTGIERKTSALLHQAPNAIAKGQTSINKLRQGNEPIQLKLQRVRQILLLFGLGQQAWRRSIFPRRR